MQAVLPYSRCNRCCLGNLAPIASKPLRWSMGRLRPLLAWTLARRLRAGLVPDSDGCASCTTYLYRASVICTSHQPRQHEGFLIKVPPWHSDLEPTWFMKVKTSDKIGRSLQDCLTRAGKPVAVTRGKTAFFNLGFTLRPDDYLHLEHNFSIVVSLLLCL